MNPVIPESKFRELKPLYPDIPAFPAGLEKIKLSAGWMIDKCGFRGVRVGDAGVYSMNPLIMVNHGLATGNDILDLADTIRSTVDQIFGIELVPEPRIY